MSILAVPLEIRKAIYSHLLASKEGLKPWEKSKPRSGHTQYNLHSAILRTCRQIYDEAYPFLLSHNVFVYQTAFSCIYTNHCLYSGGNDIYPKKRWYELRRYQPPGLPYPLSDLPRLDLIRHLELKCSTGFEHYELLNILLGVALGCLLRTLRLELWCKWSADELAQPLDALMKLEVSAMVSITVLARGPEQSDLKINILDRMLANGGEGWINDVRSANLDAKSNNQYPFLPKKGSQVGEWVLVPRRERAGGTLTRLPNE